jgi:glutamate-1-semialdehyde 2,1-aminomutase
MKKIMPAGPVFQAGTLSGNPLAMAAGLATLQELRDRPPYAQLDKLGAQLEAGLAGLGRVQRVGSMWTLFFNDGAVTDYDSAKKSDAAKFGRFFWAMLERGVYLPCSQFEAAFLMTVHTEDHINQTIAAAKDALAAIA